MLRILALIVIATAISVMQAQSQGPLFSPAPGSPVLVGEGSGLLALADVNRDGNLDLIAQHLQQHTLTVHLGDGAGRFVPAPGSPIKLAYMPGGMKVGDVNNDGMPDIVVTSGVRNAVDIYLGSADGKFSLAPDAPFQAGAATEFNTGLQLADINEDGKLDIITVSNQRNVFNTLLGRGGANSLGFTQGPATTFRDGEGRFSFAFGDVDGDGHLDAVIVNTGEGFNPEPVRAVILRGDGKGAFKNAAEIPVPPQARYVTLGDVNGDGRPDLVLTCGGNEGGNQVNTLLNQGGGKFASAAPYDLGKVAYAVAVADVNLDKRNDLVVATVDSVTVLLNGKNGFAPAQGSPFRAGPGAYHLTTGDVNRDGKPDLMASSFEGQAVTVLLGR